MNRERTTEETVFAISRNPSPPIFLSSYVLLSRLPLIPILPKKCLPFISRDADPSLAQNSRPFNAPDSKRKPHYAAAKGPMPQRTRGYWTPSLLVCYCVEPPHCCEGLRRSVECFAAAYPRVLLSFSFYSLLRVFPSPYLSSFLLLISSCPTKHYNMED